MADGVPFRPVLEEKAAALDSDGGSSGERGLFFVWS